MQNENKALATLDTGAVQETSSELQQLGSELTGKAGFIQRKEMLLTQHIEQLAGRNRSWLERLALPKEEKLMLREYAERQVEALGVVLQHQNRSLAAICGGQVTFVKEVVNTLLKTGRAGIKAGADVLFMEYRNQRAARMEKLANEFYNLVELKLADAESRPQRLQELKLREVEADLKQWEEDYLLLQEEFGAILREQV